MDKGKGLMMMMIRTLCSVSRPLLFSSSPSPNSPFIDFYIRKRCFIQNPH